MGKDGEAKRKTPMKTYESLHQEFPQARKNMQTRMAHQAAANHTRETPEMGQITRVKKQHITHPIPKTRNSDKKTGKVIPGEMVLLPRGLCIGGACQKRYRQTNPARNNITTTPQR